MCNDFSVSGHNLLFSTYHNPRIADFSLKFFRRIYIINMPKRTSFFDHQGPVIIKRILLLIDKWNSTTIMEVLVI